MSQILLFPDPRPLVERLGAAFFRQAPQCPGVYLMRDATGAVLYVGKAVNLRKRLSCYRVANPDRMPRRHLRLVRAVARIELQECADEPAALAREAELLRSLRPKFNRAGTWPGTPRFLLWRLQADLVQLHVDTAPETGWRATGPAGISAEITRGAVARLLWCGIHPELAVSEMPHAWFQGRHPGIVSIRIPEPAEPVVTELDLRLDLLFQGTPEPFAEWFGKCNAERTSPFETTALQADLETVQDFAARQREVKKKSLSAVANNRHMNSNPLSDLTPGLFLQL